MRSAEIPKLSPGTWQSPQARPLPPKGRGSRFPSQTKTPLSSVAASSTASRHPAKSRCPVRTAEAAQPIASAQETRSVVRGTWQRVTEFLGSLEGVTLRRGYRRLGPRSVSADTAAAQGLGRLAICAASTRDRGESRRQKSFPAAGLGSKAGSRRAFGSRGVKGVCGLAADGTPPRARRRKRGRGVAIMTLFSVYHFSDSPFA